MFYFGLVIGIAQPYFCNTEYEYTFTRLPRFQFTDFLKKEHRPKWFLLYSKKLTLKLANDFENQLVFDKTAVAEWIYASLFVL